MTANQLLKLTTNQLNATIYVDYENICELLKRYRKDPLEINFFQVVLKRLRENFNFNVIDVIVYSNFEKDSMNGRHQTLLRSLGIQTRHSSNNGKNSGDLELTVDALRSLYKNTVIDVFIIISSDRDIIPLLKAIKYENKLTYVLSTKTGFNQIVASYAGYHEYIEDIFNFGPEVPKSLLEFGEPYLDLAQITEMDIEHAKEVSRLFYQSKVWMKSQKHGEAISLNGYVSIISKVVGRQPNESILDFKLAHHLQYILLYHDAKKGLCLKEGEHRHQLNLTPDQEDSAF